jgi:hypothetical protein
MADKPTHEELVQRVKELEKEIVSFKQIETSLSHFKKHLSCSPNRYRHGKR